MQVQPQQFIRDHLVVRLPQRPAGDQIHPLALVRRPGQAHDVHPQWRAQPFALDVVRDEGARADNPRHGEQTVLEIGGHTGNLGEGASRAALDHPQIGPDAVHDQERIIDHSAVDPAHAHDGHQQQADSDRREGEAAGVVADILGGEIHDLLMRLPSTRAPDLLPIGLTTFSPSSSPCVTSTTA